MSQEPEQIIKSDTLQPPPIGLGQTVGRWLDDHGSSLLPALGAALMTLFGILLVSPHWYWWVGFTIGFVISMVGAGISVRYVNTISRLRHDLMQINEELKLVRERRVFLIDAALTEDWQVLLQHELLDQLRGRGFQPIIFAPGRNYSAKEQDRLFREVLETKDNYTAGIVLPIQPERREQELRHFVDKFQKPVVFADNYPFRSGNSCPQKVGFIGVSSVQGGRLAAQAVYDYARHSPVRRILVIASNTQRERQLIFQQRIHTLLPDCNIVIDEGGLFNRSLAFSESLKNFRLSLESGQPYDVVFCTSDSMTLGCIDAVHAVDNWSSVQPPRIIGYDGLEPIVRLADDRSSLVERVVIQDTHDVAVATVETLIELIANGGSRIEWLEPRLYPTLESQIPDIKSTAEEANSISKRSALSVIETTHQIGHPGTSA